MFIEPVIMKATRKIEEYKQPEEKIENLKTYVYSNVQKFGKGPEAWRSTTRIARQEIYGPYTQAVVRKGTKKSETES